MLRFYALPAEHRVIVTSNDVKKETGKYLTRVFGGDCHAQVSDGERNLPRTTESGSLRKYFTRTFCGERHARGSDGLRSPPPAEPCTYKCTDLVASTLRLSLHTPRPS